MGGSDTIGAQTYSIQPIPLMQLGALRTGNDYPYFR